MMRARAANRLRLDDLIAQRVAHKLRSRVTAQPAHDIGAVGLRGLNREVQQGGHFFCAATFGQKLGYFALTDGEAADVRLVRLRSRTVVKTIQDNFRDLGSEEGRIALHGFDGIDEITRGVGFG